MPTKKKKFIDKKNATTFRLVHRSQKDPLQADETAPKHVLLECISKGEKDLNNLQKRKIEQEKYGIYFDDDYNYLQHLKEVDSIPEWEPVLERVRIFNENSSEDKNRKLQLPSSVFQSTVEEKIGLLNKTVPEKGPKPEWDPDIVAALDDDFHFDDPNNELEDDFVCLANRIEEKLNENIDSNDEIGQLDSFSSSGNETDEAEYDGRDELFDQFLMEEETKSRFTDYSMTSSVLPRSEQLQFLDDRFEKLYEQYDDNEIGALDNEEISGHIDPNSALVMHLAEEFQKQRKTCTLKEINEQISIEGNVIKMEDSGAESEELLKISDKEEKWDCESIISTYSNLHNHPQLISEPKRNIIKVSGKTGIPVNILANRGLTKQQLRKLQRIHSNESDSSDDEKSYAGSTLYSRHSVASTIRSKNETPQERKERKNVIKQMRKERRIEKKCNKLAFKEEKKIQEKISQNLIHNLQSVKLV